MLLIRGVTLACALITVATAAYFWLRPTGNPDDGVAMAIIAAGVAALNMVAGTLCVGLALWKQALRRVPFALSYYPAFAGLTVIIIILLAI